MEGSESLSVPDSVSLSHPPSISPSPPRVTAKKLPFGQNSLPSRGCDIKLLPMNSNFLQGVNMLVGTTLRKILLGLALTVTPWALTARADEPAKTCRLRRRGRPTPTLDRPRFLTSSRSRLMASSSTKRCRKRPIRCSMPPARNWRTWIIPTRRKCGKNPMTSSRNSARTWGDLLNQRTKTGDFEEALGIGTGLVIDKDQAAIDPAENEPDRGPEETAHRDSR